MSKPNPMEERAARALALGDKLRAAKPAPALLEVAPEPAPPAPETHTPAHVEPQHVEQKPRPPRARKAPAQVPAAVEPVERMVPTNMRLRFDQVEKLRRLATARCNARRVGKPDQSELLREAVDLWLETQEVPE